MEFISSSKVKYRKSGSFSTYKWLSGCW